MSASKQSPTEPDPLAGLMTQTPETQMVDGQILDNQPAKAEPAVDRHADGLHSEVGEFIRSQRERANLSLRRLADRAGISNPYLSQIERGVRKPSAEILKRISRALSISAETLYTRAGLIEGGTATLPVVDAIEADTGLSPRQKQVLLDVYRTLVSSGPVPDLRTEN